MIGMETAFSAMSVLFVLGGAALLFVAILPAYKVVLLGARISAALLIVSGGALYLADLPYEHMPLILHGLSLLFAQYMVTWAARYEISREVLLPVMAITFYAPFLGMLAWMAADAAVKARWRAANA